MLEGLEITEIFKSDLERTQRIDSDFYSKKNLEILSRIDKKTPKALTEFVKVSDGNHMSISEYFSEDGIPYYRGGDIYNFFIEQTSQPLRIPEAVSDWPYMKRSHLQKGDVLLSIVGAIIGNLSLVKTDQKATCSCKLAILRPKSVKPELISTFLKSYFGQNQIQKFRRGSGQTGLILEDFDQLLMPSFSEMFSKKIEAIVNIAFLQSQESEQTYASAETILLETIGLKDFEPSTDRVNVKSFKESFMATGRLDSEYYQPKYEEIIQAIKTNKTGYCRLESLMKNYSTGYPYKSESYIEDGIPLIRINNIQRGELDLSNAAKVPFDDISLSPKDVANENDILISMSGTIGNSCKIPKGIKALVNQRIMRITPVNFNVDVLPLVINSIIGKYQLERIGTGGVQTNISSTDIKEILVPIIDDQIQEKIAALVEESFRLKKQSEQLLETAKRAVELAIEQDEEAAMRYIEEAQGASI